MCVCVCVYVITCDEMLTVVGNEHGEPGSNEAVCISQSVYSYLWERYESSYSILDLGNSRSDGDLILLWQPV